MQVERLDEYRWRIPRQGGMRVDGLIFADDTLLFEPGTDYSYSSYGWNLVSAVVFVREGPPDAPGNGTTTPPTGFSVPREVAQVGSVDPLTASSRCTTLFSVETRI